MIARLARLALERPVSTLVGSATLAALGALALAGLPVSLLPSLAKPRVVVVAKAAGHSAEELAAGLAAPLGRRLASLPGASALSSETRDGEVRLVLESTWQADPDLLRIEAARALSGNDPVRPDELSVAVTGGDASPVVDVAVFGGASGAVRTVVARQIVLTDLARLPGAGRVELLGTSELRVVVRPYAAALAARGLTAGDVAARLGSVGRPLDAGRVRDGGALRPLLVGERVLSLEAARAVLLPSGGSSVPLGEVASVALAEVRDGTSFRGNGRDGLLLRVFRAPGTNAVALARDVRRTVAALSSRTPAGITVEVVSDRSREVVAAVRELALSAGLGILLGTAILWLLLGSFRPTLALSVVIPASLLASFVAFRLGGVPLDVVSLSGLALAAGMLVDNSIVVLEAIETARASGSPDAPLAGSRLVAVAVAASTAVTIVVFVPLLYLRGSLARAFFGEQAFAVSAALAASLLFSLTLTPVLAARAGPVARGRNPGQPGYLRLLGRLLSRPGRAVAFWGAATLLSAASLLALPRSLLPSADTRRIAVHYRLVPGLSHEEAERRGRDVEAAVVAALRPFRTGSTLALRGLAAVEAGASDPGRGTLEVELERAEDIRAARLSLEATLGTLPDVTLRVEARTGPLAEAARSSASDAAVTVTAPDDRAARALAARVITTLAARSLELSPDEEGGEAAALAVSWDEARLARLGLLRGDADAALSAALGGQDLGWSDVVGAEAPIRLESTLPADPEVAPLRTGDGRVVPLTAVASVRPVARPVRLLAVDGQSAVRLTLRRGNAAALAAALPAVPREAGETVRPSGEALELARSFGELRLALVLSLVLVTLVLAAIYESFLVPLVVLAALPAAAAGAFAALAVTGQGLNVLSLLGLVLLVGIVSNHTIVLVDRIEQLRAAGALPGDAATAAAAERYRPVLMTTATTLLGMLPLAVLGGEGVELRRALSVAVVGGLATSTLATLFLVPALHLLVEPLRRRR